jgi:hypothetical protein
VFELIFDENICIYCLYSYKNPKKIDSCCDNPDVEVNDFLVCINCGFVKEDLNLVNTYDANKIISHRKNLYYKRLKYFRQKINLMNIKTISDNSEIDTIINNEQIKNCGSVQEIINVLSKLKKRKFIKNVYEIYYIIHKTKLFTFSNTDICNLEKLFIKFEKNVNHQKIKYLNNYNEIIFHLMNKLALSGTEHILKPRTFKKNENIYKNILATI